MAAPQRHDSNVNQKRRVRRMRCRQRWRCPQLPSAPLPFTAAEVPGMRERSRRGQRTLTLPRRIAGALEGRLRLKTNIIWNHGFLRRCTV